MERVRLMLVSSTSRKGIGICMNLDCLEGGGWRVEGGGSL